MIKPPAKKLLQKDYIQSAVRFPPKLHAQLKASADENGRSLNTEILARLEAGPSKEVLAEIAELKSMLRKVLDQM
ncbi:Arc family DNA-binding protein [Duganella sp. CY15W]|uniref:Arc family DNA-binding protein n=1 Tax=Duganella sp. CY15W TaxID=2692172 RepID=UPI0013F88315|nr:Arc family DNA-binding protein [Duganella sp. CY15W]